MKLLIRVDTGEDIRPGFPKTIYRIVEWPVLPREDDTVYPFLTNDMDVKVQCFTHLLRHGFISMLLSSLDADHLAERIKGEEEHWLISTPEAPIDEKEAWIILNSE